MSSQSVELGDVVLTAEPGFASGSDLSDGLVQVRMNNVTRDGELDWTSVRRVPANDTGYDKRFLLSR